MRGTGFLGLVLLSVVSLASAAREADAATGQPVTVFLQRNGKAVSDTVTIPAYGGGDARWGQIVGCVAKHFAPFQIAVTDRAPSSTDHITVVIGGWASQLGYSDKTMNGVGPYNGDVIRGATVYVFSRVGTGETDVSNLCSVAVHEAAHSMGLDHTFKCGDIMSYYLDRCGTRQILDVDAPCGEYSARECGNGEQTQNSYQRLAQLVGLRTSAPPQTVDDDADEEEAAPAEDEDEESEAAEAEAADEPVEEAPPQRQWHRRGHGCGGGQANAPTTRNAPVMRGRTVIVYRVLIRR